MVNDGFRMAGGEAILNVAFNYESNTCPCYRLRFILASPARPPMISFNNPSVLPTTKAGNAASYGFSVSLPDKYLWMTLDKSV